MDSGMARGSKALGAMVRFATNVFARFQPELLHAELWTTCCGWRFSSLSLASTRKPMIVSFCLESVVSNISEVIISAMSKWQVGSVQYRRYFLRGLSVLAICRNGPGGGPHVGGQGI